MYRRKGGTVRQAAKFAGSCAYCGTAFPAGQTIKYSWNLRAAFCVTCPETIPAKNGIERIKPTAIITINGKDFPLGMFFVVKHVGVPEHQLVSATFKVEVMDIGPYMGQKMLRYRTTSGFKFVGHMDKVELVLMKQYQQDRIGLLAVDLVTSRNYLEYGNRWSQQTSMCWHCQDEIELGSFFERDGLCTSCWNELHLQPHPEDPEALVWRW